MGGALQTGGYGLGGLTLGGAEISQEETTGGGDEDVGAFYVAVVYEAGVEVGEAGEDLEGAACGLEWFIILILTSVRVLFFGLDEG